MRRIIDQFELVHVLFRYEFFDKHKKEVFGFFWIFLQPALQVLIYWLVFSSVLGERFHVSSVGKVSGEFSYAVHLIVGVLAWQAWSSVVLTMTTLYSDKSSIIRKIPLSLKIFPLYVLLNEFFVYLISSLIFVIFLVFFVPVSVQDFFLSLMVLFGLLVFAYGFGLGLAVFNVFVPDLRRLVGVSLQVGFWLTPIAYLYSILPSWLKMLVSFNPVWWAVSNLQNIYLGLLVDFRLLSYLWIAALAVLAFGIYIVDSLEKDVRDSL